MDARDEQLWKALAPTVTSDVATTDSRLRQLANAYWPSVIHPDMSTLLRLDRLGKIPEHYKNAEELTEKLLHEARVFITPGFIFGSNGERYIRISLCAKEEKIQLALERIKKVI